MASKTRETKKLQKESFLAESEVRQNVLKEKGLSDKEIAKDPKIKHLKARVKQVNQAVKRIQFLEDQNTMMKEKKEKKLAEAAAEKLEEMKNERRSKKKVIEEEKAPEPKKKGGGGAKGQAKAKGADQKKKGK